MSPWRSSTRRRAWRFAGSAARPLHRLPEYLDARLPRADRIELDLSGVPAGRHVLLLAIVGSSVDRAP